MPSMTFFSFPNASTYNPNFKFQFSQRLLLVISPLLLLLLPPSSSSPTQQRRLAYDKYRQQQTTTTTTPVRLSLLLRTFIHSGSTNDEFQQPPPRPYHFSYAAGRAPGNKPDRYVEQEGDEKGVIKGSYAYLDPNWKWQKVRNSFFLSQERLSQSFKTQVQYVADPETGFHVLNKDGAPAEAHLPLDTAEVAKAKARHKALFEAIANRHKQQGSLASQLIPQPLESRRGQQYQQPQEYRVSSILFCMKIQLLPVKLVEVAWLKVSYFTQTCGSMRSIDLLAHAGTGKA